MTDAWSALLASRKFWIMCSDVIVSIILYFGSRYAGEAVYADIKFLIGVLQPVAVTMIYSIAREDAAALSAAAGAGQP